MKTPTYSALGWIIRVVLLILIIHAEHRWYLKIVPEELHIFSPGKSVVGFVADALMTILLAISITSIFFNLIDKVLRKIEKN